MAFAKLFYKHLFLSIITLGIYLPWMRVKVMEYLLKHTALGDLRLEFQGKGVDLFVINLVGAFLTVFTLYLYLPVFVKDRFNFTINHTNISDGERKASMNSTLTGKEAWVTLFTNALLLVFTLGLAFPWAFLRSTRMYFKNTEIPDEFDFDNLEQSPEDFRNATGDQAIDFLDIDIGF